MRGAAFGCSDPAQGLPEATSLLGLAAELAAHGTGSCTAFCKNPLCNLFIPLQSPLTSDAEACLSQAAAGLYAVCV